MIIDDEATLRLGVFALTLAGLLGLERRWPRRRPRMPWWPRGAVNLSLVVIDSLALRLLLPLLAVGMASLAEHHGFGLFHWVGLGTLPAALLTLLVLDLAIYAQHRLFHRVPALWRLHRVHHTDPDFDVTTALRFHPIEILLSMLWKLALVAALGAPAAAVIAFEVLLNAAAMFNHANLRLPLGVDRVLRRVVITPDMHRVHHSIHGDEANSNFGFSVPWWDWLFGSYRAQPRDGHEQMRIGWRGFDAASAVRLDRLLLQPWRQPGS